LKIKIRPPKVPKQRLAASKSKAIRNLGVSFSGIRMFDMICKFLVFIEGREQRAEGRGILVCLTYDLKHNDFQLLL
jgi:hypothetical protein